MNVHNPGQMPLALILSKTHKQLLKDTFELLQKQLPLWSTYMVEYDLEEITGHTMEELKENIDGFLSNNFSPNGLQGLQGSDFIKMITSEYYNEIESYENTNRYLVEAYNNLRKFL